MPHYKSIVLLPTGQSREVMVEASTLESATKQFKRYNDPVGIVPKKSTHIGFVVQPYLFQR